MTVINNNTTNELRIKNRFAILKKDKSTMAEALKKIEENTRCQFAAAVARDALWQTKK